MTWQDVYVEAENLCREGNHIDGVKKINGCMELFEMEVGGANSRILRKPRAFIEEFVPRMSPEQKSAAFKIFMCRGDLLVGLGAKKRAATEYDCAEILQPEDEALKLKRAKLEDRGTWEKDKDERVPCTILTGLLGSGKTSLLNHILEMSQGKRIAVIENEFGEVGIDSTLVKGGFLAEEERVDEKVKGCIQCTVRGDIISGLKKLVKDSKKSGQALDGVLIETKGLTNPASLVQTFFADEFVQRRMCLDGILTLVDAKHISQHLAEKQPDGVASKTVEQIAFADRILLNKCDLVDSDAQLLEVEKRIRAINAVAPMKRTMNSAVEMDFILGIRGFSLEKIIDIDHAFQGNIDDHQHDLHVSSVAIDVPGEALQQKLSVWFCWLLSEKGADLFRVRGVLAVKGTKQKLAFQATHNIFASSPEGARAPGEERRCKMVFIGRNLNREELTTRFAACIAE
mmetsp:Transcript_102788/g.193255  ORF Transcript_102788/g.193255 Transcript_102788/m.193255 type:complete len:457 (+) Transcript_102788:101-1471(+)